MQDSTGLLMRFSVITGWLSFGQHVAAGTSPSIAGPLIGSSYLAAYQSAAGLLGLAGPRGAFDTGLAMKAGTSPSIGAASSGSYDIAYVAPSGVVFIYQLSADQIASNSYRAGLNLTSGLTLQAGTSPHIAVSGLGQWEVVATLPGDSIVTYGTLDGGTLRESTLAKGTGPSIAASTPAGGYDVAYRGADGTLWIYSSSIHTATRQGQSVVAGTDTGIAPLSSGDYDEAVQATPTSIAVIGRGSTFFTIAGATNPTILQGSLAVQVEYRTLGGVPSTFYANTDDTGGYGPTMMAGTSWAAVTVPN